MSIQEVSSDTVFRAICDGPGCGVPALYETTVQQGANGLIPEGWYRIPLGGRWVHFHDRECVRTWLRRLSIEVYEDGGWTIDGIGGFVDG